VLHVDSLFAIATVSGVERPGGSRNTSKRAGTKGGAELGDTVTGEPSRTRRRPPPSSGEVPGAPELRRIESDAIRGALARSRRLKLSLR